MKFDNKHKFIVATLALIALVSCGRDKSRSGSDQEGNAKDENQSRQILVERPKESMKTNPNTNNGEAKTNASEHQARRQQAIIPIIMNTIIL